METEEMEKVFDYLRSLGIRDRDIEAKVLQEVNLGWSEIVLRHRLSFGDEQVWIQLYIERDIEAGKLVPQLTQATYIKPVPIQHSVINGINTGELENKMKVVDWPFYFDHLITDAVVNDFARKTLDDYWKLSFNKDEHGEEIQDILGLKYFPPNKWNARQYGLMADDYTETIHFNFGTAQHIHLIYLQASGRLETLYQQCRKLNATEDFNLEVRRQLESGLKGLPRQVNVAFAVNTPEAAVDIRIPVSRNDDKHYSFKNYTVSVTPYPAVPHVVYDTIDTKSLERDMQAFNWKDDDSLFRLDGFGGVHYHSRVKSVIDKLNKLADHPEGNAAADILKLKYFRGCFPEQDFIESTVACFNALPKREMEFTNDLSVKSAVNLLLGRPVFMVDKSRNAGYDAYWGKMEAGNDGTLQSIRFNGLPLRELERMTQMLPSQDKDAYAIQYELLEGDVVPIKLPGGARATVLADPENWTLHIFNEDHLEIPFNFNMDVDWHRSVGQQEQVAKITPEAPKESKQPLLRKPTQPSRKRGRSI